MREMKEMGDERDENNKRKHTHRAMAISCT
jgi:hypothetical protein